MWNRIIRITIWSVTAALLLVVLLTENYLSDRLEVLRAETLLVEGQEELARHQFEGLTRSLWFAKKGRIGVAICDALLLGDHQIDRPTSRLERDFPYRLLLFQALQRGNYLGCLRLSELLEDWGETFAADFRAAALLELGKIDECRRLTDAGPKLDQAWLRNRLGWILDGLSEGAKSFVYDRVGKPIGMVGLDGKLHSKDEQVDLQSTVSLLNSLNLEFSPPSTRVSLNLDLSRIAREALGDFRGSIVLLEPFTGEVLAAVSDDLTRRRQDNPWFNQRLEPASISKLITSVAALNNGLDIDDEISKMTCNGAERYRGGIMYCSFRAGPLLDLDHALGISCNIAFANLGVRLGRDKMLNELESFGFGSSEVSGIEFGRVIARNGDERQLADLSDGLEATDITPIHAALLAAVFGNNGRMPRPTFLSARDGYLGVAPNRITGRNGTRVMPSEHVPRILQAMKAVAEEGTGSGLCPPDFLFAMKTGTAATPGRGYHTNYIGIGPMSEPEIAFCVRITNQPTSQRVRRATRAVTQRLLGGIKTVRLG